MKKDYTLDKCFNCGESPEYTMDARKQFPHVIKHSTDTCPNRFVTQQVTRKESIKVWREFNKKK